MMTIETVDGLKSRKCQPCEEGVPPAAVEEAQRLLQELRGWQLRDDGTCIRREWVAEDFQAAIEFFNRVAELAEQEGHHPDLHLTGYRNFAVELTTHAIDGLSENDFILAAKINELPIQRKT
jgi:4a-hydroxytetrahydrobiopterin dehydratase